MVAQIGTGEIGIHFVLTFEDTFHVIRKGSRSIDGVIK